MPQSRVRRRGPAAPTGPLMSRRSGEKHTRRRHTWNAMQCRRAGAWRCRADRGGGAATPAALYAQTGNGRRGPSSWWCRSRPGGSTDAIGRLLAVELARIWARPSSSRTRAAPTAISARTRWQGRAGRLHAAAVGRGLERHQLRALRQHALPRQRLRACLAAGHRPQRAGGGAGFPGKTFADFIRLARESPDKYTHASSGSGSSGHLPWKCSSSRPGSIWCTCRTRAARRPSRTCWAVA